MSKLSDEQIDALDTFVLHWMAPRGRESVRAFARAIESAIREKGGEAARIDLSDADVAALSVPRGCLSGEASPGAQAEEAPVELSDEQIEAARTEFKRYGRGETTAVQSLRYIAEKVLGQTSKPSATPAGAVPEPLREALQRLADAIDGCGARASLMVPGMVEVCAAMIDARAALAAPALVQQAPAARTKEGDVCQHGIRWPHECRECSDALPDEWFSAAIQREGGATPGAVQPAPKAEGTKP